MQSLSIQNKIHFIRGLNVMLDRDLAELYDVPTKSLNLSVKRNPVRFPKDFMFQLTRGEFNSLRFQIETLKKARGQHTKYMPYAFTELGVSMLSSVLNSTKAIEVNIGIMRVFVFVREFALSHKDISIQLKALEKKYSKQFNDIHEALNYLLQKDKQQAGQQKRKRIGYKYKKNKK